MEEELIRPDAISTDFHGFNHPIIQDVPVVFDSFDNLKVIREK